MQPNYLLLRATNTTTVTSRITLLCCLWSCSLELSTSSRSYLHHHPVSTAISKLNYLAGRMALIHRSKFVIA